MIWADQVGQRFRMAAETRIVCGCSRRGLLSTTALQAVAAAAVLGLGQPAQAQLPASAQPAGGLVVAGQASIAQTANRTTVTQTSQNAAVNWQSYNVGSAHTVQYIDPSSKSMTLNRVIGPNPSEIAGHIVSNGTVIIVNQAGLLFDRGAQINTAGLVVSAAGISNSNFMAGKLVFDQAANPGAKIENRGTITIRDEGLAALVAPQVANSGVIRANLGKVILAGAEAAVLDLYGDGMLSINVTKQVTTAPDGGAALVTNTGAISARGGTVVLTAQAVDGVVQTLVNAGGKISASSAGTQTGRVVIAGVGGDVIVSGTVAANGRAAGTAGGSVVVNTTGTVAVASTARISASGPAGGGTVAIGTTLKRAAGGPSVTGQKTAAAVTIAPGATIAADATAKGNGGRVTVLSTHQTTMAGTITAKGGATGGDGGFVEVSGQGGFSLTGIVDLSAPHGAVGTILLDPVNLDINGGTAGSGSLDATLGANSGTVAANAGGTSETVSNSEIQTLGSTANIVLQTSTGTIGVHATIDVANGLNLEAGSDLLIDRGVTIAAGGGLFLSSGTAAGGVGSILIGTSAGTLGSGPVSLSGPTVVMQAGTASAGHHAIDLTDTSIGNGASAAIVVDLSAASGGVSQSAAGVINTGTLLSTGGIGGALSLPGTGNAIANLGSLAVTGAGNGIAIVDSSALTVAGAVSAAGNIYLRSSDSAGVAVAATGKVAAGVTSKASIHADAFTIASGGTVTGGVFELAPNTAGKAITLGAGGYLSSLIGIGPAAVRIGAVTLPGNSTATTTAGPITIGSSFGSAGTNLELDSGGAITQSSGAILTAGTLTGTAAGGVTLTENNTIAAIGSFAVTSGDFTLTDSRDLTVTGPVTASTAVTIVDAGTLVVSGTIAPASGTTAIAVGLTAGVIDITGTVSDGGAGTTSLVSNGGAITETGALIAGTLSGRAANGAADADASLTGANTIATLGSFSADHFDLADGRNLTVTGPVTASTAATIVDTGTLLVSGTIAPSSGTTAIAVGLTAGVIDITGTVSDGGAGTTSLVSNAGAITETGALIAGTLSGRAANGAADADASLTGANSIATLAAFSADHFSLTDGRSLTVTGPVTASSAATIVDTGTLLVSGTIAPASGTTAIAVGLTAGVLNITGTVSDGGAGTTSLVSNAGAITETGTLIAGTLSGRAMSGTLAADASLTGSTTIATLGSFTAAAFTLDDATSLTIAGPVVAQTATVSVTGSLLVNGSIGACGIGGDTTLISTGTLTVAAGALIWSLGGTVDLEGGSGFVQTGGLINGQDVVVHAASGDVTLSGGTIAAVNVAGVTASAGGISELGGVIAANSTISVLGSTGLDIESGTIISGGSVVLGTDGSLTMSGGEVAAGGDLTIGGFAPGANSYIGGTFTQSGGTLSAGSTLTVLAIGDLTVTGGIRYAADLVSDSASGTTTIDLTSGGAPIAAGSSLVYCGGLCIGTLYPGGIPASGTTVPGPDPGQTPTPAGGPASITLSGVSIVINRPEAATVVDLIAHGIGAATPGNITETGAGSIIATTLEGEALNGGTVSLLGANTITSIATFAVVSTIGSVTVPSGSFDLLDFGTVSVAGPLTAGNVTVTAGSIEVPGTIVGGTLVALYGTTGIKESGTINAGTIAANTGTVTLSTGSTGAIALSGSVGAGTLIALSAGSSGISQTAGLLNTGTLGTLSLAAIGGGVTQAAAGTIITGTLISDPSINSGTIGGTVALLGTANAIGTIGSLAATGDIQIQDASGLTIAPSATVTSTSGNIYIESSHSLGITFGANSTLAALAANATIGLQADRLTNLGTAGATGVASTNTTSGTFELAPNTAGNLVTLGTTLSTGLSLATLTGITAARVRIGAVTQPGSAAATTRAGTINAGGTFDAKGTIVLELDATRDVGQTAPLVNVGTLTGAAGSFTLTNTHNSIGTIGLATGGALGSLDATGSIIVNNGTNLTVAGLVQAGGDTTISLPGTLTLNGEVTSPAGNVWLDAGTIIVSQPGSLWPIVEALGVATLTATVLSQEAGLINAGTVTIAATGSATLDNGLIVATAGTVGINSPTVSVGNTETIAAVNSATAVSFSGNVTQADSYIGSNGNVTVGGTLTEQNGGTLLAIGNVSLGGLSQSGGLVNAGAGIAIGSGSPTAGWAGSSATSGSFYQSGGTAAATGNVNIFTSGTFLQTGGVLASGGTLGVTASNGITIGATVSAAGTPSGFMLLANGGDALLTTTGLLAGPATIAHGDTIAGNALQAPAGTVLIAGTAGTPAFGLAGAVGGAGSASTGYTLGTSTTVTPLAILSVGSAVTGTALIPAVLIGGTVDIERPIAATTLGLYAKTSIVEGTSGAITAGTLTGSAGVPASGALAAGLTALRWTNAATTGWAAGSVGSVALTGGGNSIDTLSDFAATGNFALVDSKTLTQVGTLQAGVGAAAPANTTSIAVNGGALTINGLAIIGTGSAAGGSTTLSATGALTVTGTIAVSNGNLSATAPAIASSGVIDAPDGTVSLNATSTLAQTSGAIVGGSVSLTAPAATLSSGSIVATTGTIGITSTTTVSAAEIITALNAATGVVFTGDVTQDASSYIGSNGSVSVSGLLSENGGSLLAAGNVSLGSLAQTGGTIAAGNSLTIGSSGSPGSFSQSGGLLAATGNADIVTAGAFTQTAGVLATGGTLGVTAGNGIDIAGTVSAAGPATGFTLLATAGDAVLEQTGLLAGPALNVQGDSIPGNALLAPSGTVRIAGTSGTQGFAQAGAVGGIAAVSGYAISQPASPPAALYLSAPGVAAPAAAAIAVKLSGAAIHLQRPITAANLGLYAAGGITQDANAVITASRLTGSSGADVNLLQANVIGTLGAFGDNGRAFHLVDSSNLMLAGLLNANSVWIEDVSYAIDTVAGSAFAGLGAGSSSPLKADPFPAPGSAGVYLTAAGFAVAQNPSISTGSVINWTFALTGNGNVDLGVFRQPQAKLFLSLGSGTASGEVHVAGLQVSYTTATTKTINLIGSVGGVSGQNAASGAHITPQHKNNYQINGCPISSVNCVQFTSLTVPVTNPLRDVQLGFMEYQGDADSVLPDVADRDY
jgi:filamentous hemagglutinin family protein